MRPCLFLLGALAALIRAGRLSGFLTKNPIEVTAVRKAYFQGDFSNGELSLFQQEFRLANTVAVQISIAKCLIPDGSTASRYRS
jgi:hypothetical protein